ncbi:hypothetical protein Agub_g12083 [Astrephomene gubernaculifera]|uniref:Uncharacterized protein n=1 Tax=Astrephomene gubernaculifera TaxID=47775 RepID=A0AAD3DXU9_9CHLO|nr:hypothetical protein Agub_g12083 [Astrephomene gubernaculifera]
MFYSVYTAVVGMALHLLFLTLTIAYTVADYAFFRWLRALEPNLNRHLEDKVKDDLLIRASAPEHRLHAPLFPLSTAIEQQRLIANYTHIATAFAALRHYVLRAPANTPAPQQFANNRNVVNPRDVEGRLGCLTNGLIPTLLRAFPATLALAGSAALYAVLQIPLEAITPNLVHDYDIYVIAPTAAAGFTILRNAIHLLTMLQDVHILRIIDTERATTVVCDVTIGNRTTHQRVQFNKRVAQHKHAIVTAYDLSVVMLAVLLDDPADPDLNTYCHALWFYSLIVGAAISIPSQFSLRRASKYHARGFPLWITRYHPVVYLSNGRIQCPPTELASAGGNLFVIAYDDFATFMRCTGAQLRSLVSRATSMASTEWRDPGSTLSATEWSRLRPHLHRAQLDDDAHVLHTKWNPAAIPWMGERRNAH